jgi:CO/xanthine dehydrogenase Mo-binding subunit
MDSPVFIEDIYPEPLLYAVTIRSPIAKGYIKMLLFPKLPDNYTLITARNIPGENRLEDSSAPILACGKLSYIGEPIALLLGHNKTKLEELAGQCKVIADEEKPVFLCSECNTAENEPAFVREIQIGDPLEVFEKSGKIVTSSYVTGIQDHWYAEPVGAVTMYVPVKDKSENKTSVKPKKQEKLLNIKTATQWPYHVKRSVVRMLGIEAAGVSVEPTSLSLHMDGKLMFSSLIACHAALGTFITKKPVRLILNREEDFLFSPKRCKSNIDIVSSIDENGNIKGSVIDISVNLGAYGVNGEEILDQVCLGALGYYNYENLKLKARANLTNIPPQGPFSGFGMAQGFFAMERHVSNIAELINIDPAQWRKTRVDSRLILPSVSSKNEKIGDYLIDAVTSMSDYYRKWASYELLRKSNNNSEENPRGIGIALGFQGNGLLYYGEDSGNYSVEVTLTKENILKIKTSITSSDGDFDKIWAKVAAEILSIQPDMVRLETLNAPDCGPSCASRNITVITKLVEKCCLAIRKQRSSEPLPITVRRSVKPQSGVLWDGRFKPREGKVMDINGFSKLGTAAAVVEVTIDLVECISKIRSVWLVIDGGKIISKNRARRNLTRSAAQALGWAFAENIEYDNGTLPKEQYSNFAIPSPDDIPPIYIDFLKSSVNEPKGIGELPFTCIPAAFLQAVSQAMDYCYKSIPLKRDDIWKMVRLRKTNAPNQGLK